MIRRPPRSTHCISSAASDVYKRQIFNSPENQVSSQQTVDYTKYEHITEEAIDDWIAQSSNRPIISYLDPYKKFNAPASLISNFKVRYRKWLVTKEKDQEKKKLYFEETAKDNTTNQVANRLYMNIGKKKQLRSDLLYHFEQLIPREIPGVPIQIRESNYWKRQNLSQMDGIHDMYQDSMCDGENLNKSQIISSSPRMKPKTRRVQSKLLSVVKQQIKYVQQRDMLDGSPDQTLNSNSNMLKRLGTQHISLQSSQNKSKNIQFSPQDSTKNVKNVNKMPVLKAILQPQLKSWDRQSKKAVTAKVDKILSEDHEKQVKYNNKDVENYEQHTREILEVEKKEKQNLDNVDFNFIRAVQKIKKGNYDSALNCLRQTLQYDKLHFKTIFNLACMYERIRKFDNAIKWFDLLLQFPQDQQLDWGNEIRYGLALCCYKTAQYKECYKKIMPLAEEDDKRESDHRQDIQYLRCLCLKQSQDLDQAAKFYRKFIHFASPKKILSCSCISCLQLYSESSGRTQKFFMTS
eukprot:TRINITY_DN580_c0_g1_i3.p1 TRINITY_DN580_c0_g1~~TRINITY_DN580_c0_g1_i3.p1  ORF type:complete len:520 (-),score=79.20 TRINITY_DN580_c0_g1_i3:1234-2793(-)